MTMLETSLLANIESQLPSVAFVATPIGNIYDIGLRAAAAILTADLVVCEDTRRAGSLIQLLSKQFTIERQQQRLISYTDFKHVQKVENILNAITLANRTVIISDSGMPAISDPGFKLVEALLKAQVEFTVIPGASAVLTAAVASGLPTDKFNFVGFLPRQRSHLHKMIADHVAHEATLIAFESPHRIRKTLESLLVVVPQLQIAVGFELTKLHERWYRGSVTEVCAQFSKFKNIKGECVIALAKADFSRETLSD